MALGRHPTFPFRDDARACRGWALNAFPSDIAIPCRREIGEGSTDRLRRCSAVCMRRRAACSGYTLATMSSFSWSRPSAAYSGSSPDPFRKETDGGPREPQRELLAHVMVPVVPMVNKGHSPMPPKSLVRLSVLSGINVPQIDRTVRSKRTMRAPTTHLQLMNAQQLESSAFR